MKQKDPGLRKAIDFFKKSYKLAEAAGVTPQALSQWKRVPVDRVLTIEKATNGEVTRHDMRPDIYPKD